jgi:hypothetical protein
MKKSGKRTQPRKATQRLAGKTKPRVIDSGSKKAVKPGMSEAGEAQGRKAAALSNVSPSGRNRKEMSAEMLSLEENAEKFARYAGQWLLLAEGKLIAHSGNYSVIASEIARKGLKNGLVYYMPKPEESDFVLV